jgi:hypothetical protein
MPFVHSNGTSVDDLLNDNREARTAIEDALTRIQKMEFNGRDYYPVPGSFELARAEREVHIKALRAASEYFMEIAIHCSDIQSERETRRQQNISPGS